jgi:hypothetical protein
MAEQQRVIGFDHLRMTDADKVGGKNASLGEMISERRRPGAGWLRHDRVRLSRISS